MMRSPATDETKSVTGSGTPPWLPPRVEPIVPPRSGAPVPAPPPPRVPLTCLPFEPLSHAWRQSPGM